MAEYLTRHGQSEANVQRVFAGQRDDSPLTELGREQARDASKVIATYGIAKIISSPLIRAAETAEIISEGLGGMAVQIDDRLAEYDMGAISGTPIRDVSIEELRVTPEAEDPSKFADRVFSAFFDHAHDDGNTLFVAHGGTFKILQAALQGKESIEFYNLHLLKNSEVVEIDTDLLREMTTFHIL